MATGGSPNNTNNAAADEYESEMQTEKDLRGSWSQYTTPDFRLPRPKTAYQQRTEPTNELTTTPPSQVTGSLDMINALWSEIATLRHEVQQMSARPTLAVQEPACTAPVVCTPGIKLKDVVGTVPTFNGANPPVLQFTRACRRALAMLPTPSSSEAEANLVRMLKSKLQGHAYLAVEDEPISTVEALVDALKAAFLPNRDGNYYRGELHNLCKGPSEHILDYISRTKDLHQAIVDNETKNTDRQFSQSDRCRLDAEIMENFTNGLPPELRIPLRIERCQNLAQAYCAVLKIQHLAERDVERRRLHTQVSRGGEASSVRRPGCNFCRTDTHSDSTCRHPSHPSNLNKQQTTDRQIICNYCKNPGHLKFDCELRRRNNERNQVRNQENILGDLSPSATQVAPLTQRSSIAPGNVQSSLGQQ